LPPDVNLSGERFLVRGTTIRRPLDQIKGLDQSTVARIRTEAPFATWRFSTAACIRATPEWLALVQAGAFDSLGEPRGRVFWRLCRLEAGRSPPGICLKPDRPRPACRSRSEIRNGSTNFGFR
jgi:DNA polymerase III alpha subunit